MYTRISNRKDHKSKNPRPRGQKFVRSSSIYVKNQHIRHVTLYAPILHGLTKRKVYSSGKTSLISLRNKRAIVGGKIGATQLPKIWRPKQSPKSAK